MGAPFTFPLICKVTLTSFQQMAVKCLEKGLSGKKEEEQAGEPFRMSWVWSAAAKSLQSCPTLCDPIDGSPPGSPVPGILQARTLEWVAISFSNA